jgi:hypothetical protein
MCAELIAQYIRLFISARTACSARLLYDAVGCSGAVGCLRRRNPRRHSSAKPDGVRLCVLLWTRVGRRSLRSTAREIPSRQLVYLFI